MAIRGWDALSPPAPLPTGFRVAAAYVAGPLAPAYVWTAEEVRSLAGHVEGWAPIVGPPQSWPWPEGIDVVLEGLLAQVRAWGGGVLAPLRGLPVYLDVEQPLADAMGSELAFVLSVWAGLAEGAGYVPGVYGSNATLLLCRPSIRRWLALWPSPTPADPVCPPGVTGWQYRGSTQAEAYDLSVWQPGVFVRPDLGGLITVSDVTANPTPTPAPATPAAPTAYVAEGSGYWAVVPADLSSKRILATAADGSALIAAGYPKLAISPSFVDSLPAEGQTAPAAPTTAAPTTPVAPAHTVGLPDFSGLFADPAAAAAFLAGVATGEIVLPALEDPLAAKPFAPAPTAEEIAAAAKPPTA